MHLLLISCFIATPATAAEVVLKPGVCENRWLSGQRFLDCIDRLHQGISMEISGQNHGYPEGPLLFSWSEEPVSVVLQRFRDTYPDLRVVQHDVGDRLFLASDPSFAGSLVTLPQTTYPDGMTALTALVDAFHPDGMKAFHEVRNVHSLTRDPKPVVFRSTEASMMDFMDQWLDATMPSARWSLRCNTASRQCGISVIRYVNTTLPDGWVDPDP